jgi:hypothetical protein
MPQNITGIWLQIIGASALLRYRVVRWTIVAGFAILWLATELAPDNGVSALEWTRLFLIGILATLSILCFAASRHLRISLQTRQARIIGAALLFLLALILNLTLGIASAAIFCLGFSIITIEAMTDRRGRTPWILIGSLALLIPFWAWTALDAWSAGLLFLIPIALLALLGDQHMRETVRSKTPDDPLSARAHRLGAWLAIMVAAILVLVVSLFSDASNGWAALGAAGAIVAVALEAGYPRPLEDPRRYAVLLCDAAFAWIAFCWLVGL